MGSSPVMVKEKTKKLKKKIQPKQTKPTLWDPDVKPYLEHPTNIFVVITIDKIANNFGFNYKILRL